MSTRHPIYVPSKGRAGKAFTVSLLLEHSVPFFLVVEKEERDEYRLAYPGAKLLTLPSSGKGIAYVRRKIKRLSINKGESYHWQIDDNIKGFCFREIGGKSKKLDPEEVLRRAEAEVGKYSNIGMAGLKHAMFAFSAKTELSINQQVYSCVLVNNSVDAEWKTGVVEDTDYSLQVLTQGFCTLLFNTLVINKVSSGSMKGGNTDAEYGDGGRNLRAKGLQREWPGFFKVKVKEATFDDCPQPDVHGRVKPSRVWSTFKQVPILK